MKSVMVLGVIVCLAGHADAVAPAKGVLPKLAADPAVAEILDGLGNGAAAELPAAKVTGDLNEAAKRYNLHKNGPGGRNYGIEMIWMADRERAIYCSANRGSPHRLNDVWEFDLAARKREEIKGEQPPPSVSDCMTYVPDLAAIVRWVASDNAAWFLDLKTRTWSKKPIPNGPRLGLRSAMTYDTKRKQVLLYGGQVLGGPHDVPGAQLWALSVTDLKWARLPDGPADSAPGWAYAPRHDVALCWRKVNPESWHTGEGWVCFPGEQKWLRLESPKPIPPKLYQNLTYDESRDVFVCHTRPLKWYVMRLAPAKLKGAPQEYVKRMER